MRIRGRGWTTARGAARGVALLAVLALSACQSTRAPRSAPPPGTHEGLNAILWLQTAAEYRAATRQAFRSATVHLDLALAEPTWTAAPEQTGDFGDLPPAVVLDMDEAILRSDRFQAWLVKEDERYRLEDWNAWVRTETSEAIAGALEYVAAATARGVQIFYVTNRTAEVEEETLATLRKVGFPIESADDLLTQDERPEWGADKSSRRAEIAATHRILQIVGDNLNDFTGGAHDSVEARRALAERYSGYWGARWIITPNPSYGGWEGALTGFERGLSRAERIRRKRSFLESWR